MRRGWKTFRRGCGSVDKDIDGYLAQCAQILPSARTYSFGTAASSLRVYSSCGFS
jgi:hypothetical protein